MIKPSLTRRLIVVFSAILIVVALLNMLLNAMLLPKVHTKRKIDAMVSLYNDLSEEYEDNSESENIITILKDTLSDHNLRVFIWDKNNRIVIDSFPLSQNNDFDFTPAQNRQNRQSEATEKKPERNFMFERREIFLFDHELNEENIIQDNENFSVFSFESFDNTVGETLCLRGYLPKDYKILIQMPVAAIDEAVYISNILLLMVGGVMLIIGIVIVFITSKTIAKPVKELSVIAEKMQNLDFSTKYKSKRQDEIGRLGESINILSKKLEHTINELYKKNIRLEKDIELKSKIDNIRKEFIANASHELKTPVALIQGYAEGLSDNVASDEESRKVYTDVIIEETKHMDHIIHQMLDLMEIDGEENFNGTVFSLSSLVEESIANFAFIIKSKKIRIEFSSNGECTVYGDYSKIRQAVTNYISNAINHAAGEKIIRIFVKETGDKILVSVYNTGVPIPVDDLPSIWERFYKVDKARTREYGGTGLGLSIVRSVIELHNGTYGCANHEDGVEFYFTLNKEI